MLPSASDRRVPGSTAELAAGGDTVDVRPRASFITWLLVTFGTALVGAVMPLIWNPRFYYYDDTASGAFGIWFEIGQKLRSGEWPLFSNEAWMAGNYAAEGQWGIWNPLILLIGLGASFATNALIFTTALKIVTLAVLAVGTYLLARSYGTSDAFAASAGLSVTLAGFTVYVDGPSWVTGLFVFALLPWVMWSARALVLRRTNPLVPFLFGYLLITVGYVHGTIMLVIALGGLLLEAVLTGRRQGIRRLLVLGVLLGLVALATYLPGVLTASVSSRESEILNSGFLATDLTGLATSFVASSTPQVSAWWGFIAPVPLLFSTWLLPALCLVDFKKASNVVRSGAALVTLFLASLALTLAPSDLGPLRFPVRLAPYLALAVIVLVHVLLSRFRVERPTPLRLRVLSVVMVSALYLAFSQAPEDSGLHLFFVLLVCVGIVGIVFTSRRLDGGTHRARNAQIVIASVTIVLTLTSALIQRQAFPSSPLPDYHLPNDVSAYSSPLDSVDGASFVVGRPTELSAEIWDETLFANTWYLSEAKTHNLYSPVQFEDYAFDLCMDSHGWTCQGALGTLFTPDDEVGALPVDLLSINAVQILRSGDDEFGTELRAKEVPVGWQQTWSSRNSRIWERVGTPAKTGDVVATEDASVVVLEQSDTRVEMRVDSTGPDGGAVTFSRLAWPGYSASGGAAIGQPLRGYLLRIDLPPTTESQSVIVEFRPPGWWIVVGSIVLSLIGLVSWSLVHVRQRGRSLLTAQPSIGAQAEH